MAEHQEVKEHNNLVNLHGITIREDTDTESEHFYYKLPQSQGGDSMLINGHNKVEIKINNKYASLVPKLTREEYESLKKSIKQDGLLVPLIVNQDGILLDEPGRGSCLRKQINLRCFRPKVDG